MILREHLRRETAVHVYARLHHGIRREDVQVARHRHSPLRYLEIGMNPEWLRYYICAS